MKRTVLNLATQLMAIVAMSLVVVSTSVAQTSGGLSVDQAFAKELKLVEGLKVYNDQLAKQLEAQGLANREILASISQSKDLGPQIVPILQKMLVALERFIEIDLPFHEEERLSSVDDLKALMVNSEASDSDRFRNIMDIYSVEIEYGNTYEAYPGVVGIEGTERPVDMLRVGRLGLYYQTKDQKSSGMWDRASGKFVSLPDSTNRNIRKAIKVAAKTTAPELLSLPLTAPEGV